MTRTRLRRPDRRLLGLGAALAAGALLLFGAPTNPKAAALTPLPVSVAWAKAQAAAVPATLADGTAYTPLYFLDAKTSIGSAPAKDGSALRLLYRDAKGSLRQLRRVPQKQNPSFGNVVVSGNTAAWLEGTGSGRTQVWAIDLKDGHPARLVTPDTGQVVLHDSEFDLSIAAGRLYWIATDNTQANGVQVRSVPLTGGAVQTRTETGSWQLSTWPYLVNGVAEPDGTTLLRNLVTGKDTPVKHASGLQTTNCSPAWCQVVTFAHDGANHIELRHLDGSGRIWIPGSAMQSAIADVTPLEKFAVLAQIDGNVELTRNRALFVFQIATHQIVELSLDAATVTYRNGVLWWSNGGAQTTIWHTLDLRTV
jgi:hypothetical protein